MTSDFARILGDANEAGLPFVVVGGIAVIRHGVIRATRDVDLVVEPSDDATATLRSPLRMKSLRLRRAFVLSVLATALLVPGANAQGVDTTCTLTLTKTDPATVNVAYPDEAAIYWISAYEAVPGTRLRITGRYPHARYFSFNVYDQALRPIDAIADVEIAPDAGSVNPFAATASRTGDKRNFTAYVDFGPVPAQRAPNTIYTGTGQSAAPNLNGTLILRVYVPDHGRDETGGVGLPTITLESTAPSGGRPSDSACTGLAKPPVPGLSEAVAAGAFPVAPAGLDAPGQPTPRWVKFRNLVQVANRVGTDNPFFDSFTGPLSPAEDAGGNGGFLSNVHNAYVYAALNRSYGEVSVTRMRVPETPDTRPGPATMPDAELRYFSMCTNDFASQRFIGCATDDRTAVGTDGFAEYVVSTQAARPSWATPACGYTWLPFGPNTSSGLILRHMLPRATFAQAIQRAKPEHELATMGTYLPSTRYLKSGERLGCRATRPSSGRTVATPPSVAKKLRVRVAFPGGVRKHLKRGSLYAHVYVRGGKVKALTLTLRDARGRLLGRSRPATVSRYRHAAIKLRRPLPTGRIRVTLTARRASGKKLTMRFRFRVPALS